MVLVDWFRLVGFYGISSNLGYLMPNPVFIYKYKIYDLKARFHDTFLNESEFIFSMARETWVQSQVASYQKL